MPRRCTAYSALLRTCCIALLLEYVLAHTLESCQSAQSLHSRSALTAQGKPVLPLGVENRQTGALRQTKLLPTPLLCLLLFALPLLLTLALGLGGLLFLNRGQRLPRAGSFAARIRRIRERGSASGKLVEEVKSLSSAIVEGLIAHYWMVPEHRERSRSVVESDGV